MNIFKILLFSLLFCIAVDSQAQPGNLSDGLEVKVFLDAYYSYNFREPQPVSPPNAPETQPAVGNNKYHVFDNYHDSFNLALAELVIEKEIGQTTAFLNLGFGNNTEILSPNDEVTKHILEAYVIYRPESLNGLSLQFGKMNTHIGLEVSRAHDNWNYSRSFLFGYAGPYWHTGVAIRQSLLQGRLNAGVFVYNENVGLYEANRSKSYGLQLQSHPMDSLEIIYNFLAGSELDVTNKSHTRVYHELIIISQLLDNLEASLDLIYGELTHINNSRASWLSWTLGLKWTLGKFHLSPRYEMYVDKNGVTVETATTTRPSLPQKLQSITLTGGWSLTSNLEARLEVRRDQSSTLSFPNNRGALHTSQTVTILGMLYSF